jgi:hypothetical protein
MSYERPNGPNLLIENKIDNIGDASVLLVMLLLWLLNKKILQANLNARSGEVKY